MDHVYGGRVLTKKLTAMVASSTSTPFDQPWYTNSGASTHVTSDLANLSLHNEYHANDKVAVGNGQVCQFHISGLLRYIMIMNHFVYIMFYIIHRFLLTFFQLINLPGLMIVVLCSSLMVFVSRIPRRGNAFPRQE